MFAENKIMFPDGDVAIKANAWLIFEGCSLITLRFKIGSEVTIMESFLNNVTNSGIPKRGLTYDFLKGEGVDHDPLGYKWPPAYKALYPSILIGRHFTSERHYTID